MACACKTEKKIAEYNKQLDKINNKRRTLSDWLNLIKEGLMSFFLRLIGIIFIIILSPILVLFIIINIIIGKKQIVVSLPEPIKKYITKNIKKYGDSEIRESLGIDKNGK